MLAGRPVMLQKIENRNFPDIKIKFQVATWGATVDSLSVTPQALRRSAHALHLNLFIIIIHNSF